MRKRFQVRKYKHPRLKFVLNYREAGKRKRKFFETRAKAAAEAALKNAQLRKAGIEGAEFPSRLRVMAWECAKRLSARGKTLQDATDFLVAHLEATEKSCTVAALIDELLDGKKADEKSKRYLQDLKWRLNGFAQDFGGRMVATITSAQINDWLRKLKGTPVSRNNYRRVLVVLFNHAVKRKYAPSFSGEDIAEAKVVAKPPGILTVPQTACLLEAAAPELLPYLAIGAFAGLRRAELERLDWSDVHFDGDLIEVTAANAKMAQRRLVKMQPNLREWLLPLSKRKGRITPQDFRRQFNEARESAGLFTNWPDNGLRHSFASYHLAHFNDTAALALQMGNSPNMIFKHYRELVRPKEAERYWNIRPARENKVVPLVAHA
jgi:integrase